MLAIVERQGLIVLGYRMRRVDRIVGRGRESVRDCNSAELGEFNLIEHVQRKNLVVSLDS